MLAWALAGVRQAAGEYVPFSGWRSSEVSERLIIFTFYATLALVDIDGMQGRGGIPSGP